MTASKLKSVISADPSTELGVTSYFVTKLRNLLLESN